MKRSLPRPNVSRYRKVDVRIWTDDKFLSLSKDGKLIFMMLLTHPTMTALGGMKGTPGGLAEELDYPPDVFLEAFGNLVAKGMVEYEKGRLIALPNFLKYNPPESPNAVKGWEKAFGFLPECDLKAVVAQRAVVCVKGMPESFREALPEALRHSENSEQGAENREQGAGSREQRAEGRGQRTNQNPQNQREETSKEKHCPEHDEIADEDGVLSDEWEHTKA